MTAPTALRWASLKVRTGLEHLMSPEVTGRCDTNDDNDGKEVDQWKFGSVDQTKCQGVQEAQAITEWDQRGKNTMSIPRPQKHQARRIRCS